MIGLGRLIGKECVQIDLAICVGVEIAVLVKRGGARDAHVNQAVESCNIRQCHADETQPCGDIQIEDIVRYAACYLRI